MYIVDPTEEMLKSWYACKKVIASYLMIQCKFPVIHKKGEICYFAKTEELQKAIDNMPVLTKIFGAIGM